MVSLDIEKPHSCLSCPCLHTLANIPDIMNKEKTYAARFCMAAHKDILICEDDNAPLPEKWYKFEIPKWCPWIETKNNEKVAKNLVKMKLGGCY